MARPDAIIGNTARRPCAKALRLLGMNMSLGFPGLILNQSISHSPVGNKMYRVDASRSLNINVPKARPDRDLVSIAVCIVGQISDSVRKKGR